MSRLSALPMCCIAAALLALGVISAPTRAADAGLDDLCREVAALQTLFDLDLAPAQLTQIKKMAAETVAKGAQPGTAQASEALHHALSDLKTALVAADDDERVSKFRELVDDLTDDEDADVAGDVDITDAARRVAPQLMKSLASTQVAAYVSRRVEDVTDPMEQMMLALEHARDTEAADWDQFKSDTSAEVGLLVAGLDPIKSGQVASQVSQWLSRARDPASGDLKARHGEFETSARQIVGSLDPMECLRHWIERDLAELLSNPRLVAAIDARKASDK